MKATLIVACFAMLLVASLAASRHSAQPRERLTRTRVVLLGTGTPVPDPERSGPATAIVVDSSAYLVDFGPGVVRRAGAFIPHPRRCRRRSARVTRDPSLSGEISMCTESHDPSAVHRCGRSRRENGC
jgi:hypothetical protein